MPDFDYDLLVIGGGPAGEKGGAQAAYFGHRVALVERRPQLGGACINTGTLASKTLRESALFLSGFKARQLYGIEASVKKDISLQQFMYRTSVVQDRERERAAANLARHNIERLDGAAEILDPHKVVVRIGPREEIVTARFILIATGSSPHRPADIPFNRQNVFDSDSVLEMKSLPTSMLIVGGGVIGCEYACIFAALGIRALLVDGKDRLLGFLDHEIGDALTSRMRGMGIGLLMPDSLESVKLDGPTVRTRLKSAREIETDALLYAAGRSGNVTGLGIEKLGIVVNKRGQVEVDPITYQTKVPNIYAAGDVIGFPALASTSMEQGRLAVCHAFDLKYKTRLAPILPYGIYTIPEVSCVGESEESCREKKIDHVVGRTRFGQHARGQIIGDTEGVIKLVFAAPSGKLLGAHVIGEMASELVHVAMACLHFDGGVDYFIQSVFNYPTLGDAFKYAAYDALGQLNKLRAKG